MFFVLHIGYKSKIMNKKYKTIKPLLTYNGLLSHIDRMIRLIE